MAIPPLPTRFAPAERAAPDLLTHQVARLARISMMRPLLDAIPDCLMILNAQRQIVFANQALLALVDLAKEETVLGMRLGEVLGCTHATEEPGGCGTSEACQACGAVRAVLSSLSGKEDAQECRICLKNGEALDMGVYATPMRLSGQAYTFIVLKDISHEKRRLILERLFFHDVLNSAGALRGLADVMHRAPLEDKDEIADDIWMVCDRLIDEIKSQKQLAAAESHELRVERGLIHTKLFLEETLSFYQNLELARMKQICLDPASCDVQLVSDRVLLRRVIGNMIKNGLEACRAGDKLSIGCRLLDGLVEFWVNNPGVISENVRLQIFQRSFSTKGPGRGLGTYSMKVLGERYLKGQVYFSSLPIEGTTFAIKLPLA